MTIQLKWSRRVQHTPEEEELLRQLYRQKSMCPLSPDVSCPLRLDVGVEGQSVKQIIIEEEVRAGFSGARLLVVTPIESEGTLQTRRVVKLGPRVMLEAEISNYYRFVREHLLTAVAAQKNFVIRGTMAAIEYIFVGGGMLDPVSDLATYCKNHSAREIAETLDNLLSNHLGECWYSQKSLAREFIHEEHGPHMPEHVSLDLHSLCRLDDESSPVHRRGWFLGLKVSMRKLLGSLTYTANALSDSVHALKYRPLEVDVLLRDQNPAKPGELVQIQGLEVVRVKPWAATFVHREDRAVWVRVDYEKESGIAEQLSIGQCVTVRGQVSTTRHRLLETVVQAAFEDCSETQVSPDDNQVLASLGCAPYTNPLKLYPYLLDETVETYHSIIHGDLHTRNVLVDGKGRPWLIDFGQVHRGQTLYDFVRLETYLRWDVLGEGSDFTLVEYVQFEEALASATCDGPQTEEMPTNSDLQKAFHVMLAIRRSAGRFYSHGGKHKNLATHFSCLLLHNLGALKYTHRAVLGKDIDAGKRDHLLKIARLCFITAAVQGRWLESLRPSRPWLHHLQ